MKKILCIGICAAALATTPAIIGHDRASADDKFWKGLGIGLGAAIVGGAIVNAVRAGQSHCHQGNTYYCHSHAFAQAYHYHQYPNGPILYQQATVAPPPVAPPVAGPGGQIVLPQAHVQWCYDNYRSYDLNTNSFQPFQGPRRPCISPYFQ